MRLETILSATVLALASFLPSCAVEKSRDDLTYLTNKFYTQRNVLEESSIGDFTIKKVEYTYVNGIQVEVKYEKKGNIKNLFITVKNDPNNLLIRNTPKTQSAVGSTYNLSFGETHFRQLNFEYLGKKVQVTFDSLNISYKLDDKEVSSIPHLFSIMVYKKLGEIDLDLFITEHIIALEKL